MRTSRFPMLCCVLLLSISGADAARFSLPTQLPNFQYVGPIPSAGSPIQVMLQEHPTSCDDVGVYAYTDGAQATAGLAAYLKQIGMTAKETQRTDHAVVWTAQGRDGTLMGVWRTVEEGGGVRGVLEMCGQAPVVPATTGKKGSSVLFWLAGAGLFVAARVARSRARS
ncbi:hypothetical protein [Deinococcus enclensis]|uniref:Uncharacterized protein n=1 Tax=Deinococcus enclensis TaxID=1049582 RepID=A0ABT9ME93_9DEIO|nr:hypothetical protein [Deinococcus enclensis]MDP9764884.1 hypothetical protein [Deinococcus enclensis]